ncbi:hypothetical protein PHLCEN_2v5348 [Hermanssonia centrifuga]|uniref:DNA-binding protein RAP1 n=1 Tax=Hermanssonia centrifuga TaxID=98765 RepID=A0A2R6P5K0_9APHY|nr:hypothetical protein PHLCEN_2v5348 [Hermanssonia centrifuga]
MPIFQDQNGMAIKFFIQKDIPDDIQAEVCETITSLGGRVEAKVPRAGYILVQPGTSEEERLRTCWSTAERPERYFVPYTYVEACKMNGMLLKQIFVHDGHPIPMHIDSSIANVNVRHALSTRIQHSGGDPTASPQSARVILADPNTEIFQHLVKTHQSETNKYVESYLWVKKCIERGAVVYTPVVYKNPGGRRAGEERTHFTEEDEERLCDWIASKIPYKETGGRTGNRLYRQLCEMANNPDYGWVTRHTWQSWRERYKKNAPRLDIRISGIVERKRPALGEKGQYGYVRKPEERMKRSKKKVSQDGEGATVAGPSNDELDFMSEPVMLAGPPPPGVPGALPPTQLSDLVYPQLDLRFPHENISPEVAAARQNATEEEDDESEWQIRVNDGTQPQWAKRKAEPEEEGPIKKQHTESQASPHSEQSGLHVVDQAVQDIADEYRFTVGEVKEYYDKCGDVDKTRNRFRKMREILSNLPEDDPPALAPNSSAAT